MPKTATYTCARASTNLDETKHDEPRAGLGEVHKHRREPDAEPVSLAPSVFVRRFDRLPVPLVCPREQAAVVLPTHLDLGKKAAVAAAAAIVAGVLFRCEVDEGVVGTHSYENGAPYHYQHQDRVEHLDATCSQKTKKNGQKKQENRNIVS